MFKLMVLSFRQLESSTCVSALKKNDLFFDQDDNIRAFYMNYLGVALGFMILYFILSLLQISRHEVIYP